MYTILSPSKTQDFSREMSTLPKCAFVAPEWNKQTKQLVAIMKGYTPSDFTNMMKVSPRLARLTHQCFQAWDGDYGTKSIHMPAIAAFLGDVYKGFNLGEWSIKDYKYAQEHLGIVSGLYGLIAPLNNIQPYRLEMGTRANFTIDNVDYKNLYTFWQDILTNKMVEILNREKILVNLASVEYSKVFNRKDISIKTNAKIIDIDFKINKNGITKVIAIYAKRARGLMANWIIENKIDNQKDLKKFAADGWEFIEYSEPDALGNVKMLFIKSL